MADRLKIRAARVDDAKRIQRIVTDELYLDRPGFHWHRASEIRRAVDAGEYFVAVVARRIVGVLAVRPEDDTLWIEVIAVTPAHRGRGYGRALVAYARDLAVAQRRPWLRVSTYREYCVQPVYEAYGFTLFDEVPDNVWLQLPTAGGLRPHQEPKNSA